VQQHAKGGFFVGRAVDNLSAIVRGSMPRTKARANLQAWRAEQLIRDLTVGDKTAKGQRVRRYTTAQSKPSENTPPDAYGKSALAWLLQQ
jgi:hypothetical protein